MNRTAGLSHWKGTAHHTITTQKELIMINTLERTSPTSLTTFSLLASGFPWETLPDDMPILEQYSCSTHQVFMARTETGERHLFLHLERDIASDDDPGLCPSNLGELRELPEWAWMNDHLPRP